MAERAVSGNGRAKSALTSWRGPHDRWRRLAWRQNHDDLAAFETRFLFDLGDLCGIAFHPVEQLVAELLVGHFAAAEPQRDLDLIAFFEESLDRAHLHLVVVIVDHRPQLDLLDLDDLLLLARLGGFLLRLIFVFAEIEDFADRRDRIRRDLDQIEPGLLRHGYGGADFRDALVGAVFVDELNLANADLLVDARTLLGGGLHASARATNGYSLLWSLLRAGLAGRNPMEVDRPIGDAKRQTRKIGTFRVQVNDNALAYPWCGAECHDYVPSP